jgi:hypothetical protein
MRSKRTLAILTVILVFLGWLIRSKSFEPKAPAVEPSANLSGPLAAESPPMNAASIAVAKTIQAPTREMKDTTPEKPLPSLSEIIRSDNICALEKFISRKRENKKLRTYQSEAEDAYFSNSPFKSRYMEYAIAISGMPGANTKQGQFLSALRMADWIEDGAKFEGLVDRRRALRDLKALAFEDGGNAAPAAFAYALGKGTDPQLAQLIREADHFDTYQLDYLRALADFEDPSMVSFFIRVSHHATLAIPNWSKFKTEFILATENDLDLRLHVTDLMMKNAKESKNSSYELGYNVLETAYARSMAGGSRAYPKFTEIDAAFPLPNRADISNWEKLMSEVLASNCDLKKVETLRHFVREFRSKNPRSNLAF